MPGQVADPAGGIPVDPANARETRDERHLAEEVRRDHGVREGDHQKVDADAPRRDRPEHQSDGRRHRDRDDERHRRVPAEVETLGGPARTASGGEVAENYARDPEQGRLGERDHAAVRGEEDQARCGDAEQKRLDQDLVRPVLVENERPERGEYERDGADGAFDRRLRRRPEYVPPHPGLPNRPCGRNARTSAISAKVTTIEYCVQQSAPAVGRYVALKLRTNA